MYRQFVQSMMAGRPYLAADTGSGGTDPQDPPKDPQDPPADPPSDPQDPPADPQDPPKVEFSEEQQSFINNLINQKVKDERTKAEQKRQQEIERAKLSEQEKLQADLEDNQKKLEAYNNRVLNYELKDVARDMGVSAKKLERFLKVVDRDELEVDEDGNADRSKVEAAVKAALADMPEFKGSENPKGPGGGFDKGAGGGAKYSKEQIASMSEREIADNYDEVMKSMAIHNGGK